MNSCPALFLDRDGVINVDYGHVYRREDFDFIPGIFPLVKCARLAGYRVIVVTNQAGIGRGYYSEAQFQALTKWMMNCFESEGASVDAVYHCPYHPQHGIGFYRKESADRKPRPGMFLRAANDWNIDLARSALVGDKATDIIAAMSAGIPHRFLYRSTDSVDHALSVTHLSEVISHLELLSLNRL